MPMSVHPSVRPSYILMVIQLGFFLFERYTKNSNRSHEDSRSKSLMKFLASFLYLRIRQLESIRVFFISKVQTRKKHQTRMEDLRSWSRTKVLFAISSYSYLRKTINLIYASFENADKKVNLSNSEVDRTRIKEVRPERNFRQFVIFSNTS